jgi:hypothetical protein
MFKRFQKFSLLIKLLKLLEPFKPYVVRMKGLEPPSLAASDPKSDVSANFTTSGSFGNLKDLKSLPVGRQV